MKTIKFGIIGLGLMGREFASAAARWLHLTEMTVKPEIIAICSESGSSFSWYKEHISTIVQCTTDYKELLANDEVEAVYCAVPNHLHEEFYTAILASGKHLLGEKPFGIDLPANQAILKSAENHPELLTRSASQFPFFPGAQRITRMIEQGDFGTLLEVNAGFLHSSDLDPEKPINWKRMVKYNGEYGVMGDLGMHVVHIPFRAGWKIHNVRAILSDIIPQRPDASGQKVPCDTWDNATLLCETSSPGQSLSFPMTLKFQRIAPGEKNSWYLEIIGTRASARFSTKEPKHLEILEYRKGQQRWQHEDIGYETVFPTLTGSIFEFGFSDAILQMWAAYLYELEKGKPAGRFAQCVTPRETALSHQLFTAALRSHAEQKTVQL